MDKVRKTDPPAEPDELELPPADPSRLRTGFTTGTAATAAAVAATRLLAGQPVPSRVSVRLPQGDHLVVTVAESSLINADEALAVVVKDGGDDPDVTSGAEIGAIVRRLSKPGLLHLVGGRGVGRVTKPGLALPPGEWAINPGPRAMIRDNLTALFRPRILPGAEVEIFVERGEELAQKTLNPRLGILGGISILGTTGLVKPFSHEAYLATIESSLDLARALGLKEVVLTTGRQSEKLARTLRPDLPLEAFVQVADFFGDSLTMAAARAFPVVGLACFFGKAVKQAMGLYNTHAHRADQEPSVLADWLTGPGREGPLPGQLAASLTARAALDHLKAAGETGLIEQVARRALTQARAIAGPEPKLWLSIFDYDGRPLVDRQTG